MRWILCSVIGLWVASALADLPVDTCAELLTLGQREVLTKAAQSSQHFTWLVQTGFVQDKLRTVVILGEKHAKFESDSQLGQEILAQFPAYGLEGLNFNETWLGWLMGAPGRLIKSTLKVYDRYVPRPAIEVEKLASGATVVTVPGLSAPVVKGKSSVLGRVARFIFYGQGQHGSTIGDAHLRGRSRLLRYQRRLQEVATTLGLESLAPEEAARVTIFVGQKSLSGLEFLAEIRQVQEQIQTSPLDFNLEEGHRFSWVENVGSILLPSTLIACVYKLGGSTAQIGEAVARGTPFIDPTSQEALETFTTAGGVALGMFMALAGDRLFGRLDFGGRALNWMVDKILGDGRNITMANNVAKVFSENPDLDILLVIAGKAHVQGLAQNLQHSHGFATVKAENFLAAQ